MDSKQKNKKILALKRCINETFSKSRWKELGYWTDGKEIIQEHPRLLRSYDFGDDDYEDCILDVLETLIEKDSGNLEKIIEYTKLEEWLNENNRTDYDEIFGHTNPLLDSTEKVAISNSFDLQHHILRIRRSIESDPSAAIGSTKDMVESVLTIIVEGFGEQRNKEDDIPKLLKRVQGLLTVDPKKVDPDAIGSKTIKTTLSNLGQVVIGVAELRNMYGTGHGKSSPSKISPRHARLVVGAGATLAVFLMETYEYRKEKSLS